MNELEKVLEKGSQPVKKYTNPNKATKRKKHEARLVTTLEQEEPTQLVKRPKKSQISIGTLYRSFNNFEETAGGRMNLAQTLAMCPAESPSAAAARKLLADPELFGPKDLMTLCFKNKLDLAAVVAAFRDAKLAQIAINSLVQVADKAPQVVEQMATDSQNRYDECPVCEGTTRVPRIGDNGEWMLNADGERVTQLCYTCRGTGKVFVKHDVQNRKMFLEFTGVIENRKTPLIQQNFDQKAFISGDFLPGDGSFEGLIKAVDTDDSRSTIVIAEEEIIDIPNTVYEEESNPESTT